MTAPEPPEGSTDGNDALLRMANRLDTRLGDLSSAIKQETESRRVGFLLATIAIVVALVAAGVGIYAAYSTRATANCTSDWARASQARTLALAKANVARTDSIDKFDRAVATLSNTIGGLFVKPPPGGGVNPAAAKPFEAALAKLVTAGHELNAADHAYDVASQAHPLSDVATKLNC